MEPGSAWSLDPQLARDTVAVGDLPLSRVLAMNDANYPWLILVPRQPGMVEIVDLAGADQIELMREINHVGCALRDLTRCDKLNIAALGNSVRQLHVHVIARFKDDAAGARPVWGVVPAKAYDTAALDSFIAAVRKATGLGDTPPAR
jgi:diadenosine tetraphosphate (Ap4A) HIT family hydrolase